MMRILSKKRVLRYAIGLFLLGSISISAHADWQCAAQNTRGQIWYSHGLTRGQASGTAILSCTHNSIFPQHCILVYCRAFSRWGMTPHPAMPYHPVHFNMTLPARWQCTVQNSLGQQFIGLGVDQASASANASWNCAQHTLRGHNCIVRGCLIK